MEVTIPREDVSYETSKLMKRLHLWHVSRWMQKRPTGSSQKIVYRHLGKTIHVVLWNQATYPPQAPRRYSPCVLYHCTGEVGKTFLLRVISFLPASIALTKICGEEKKTYKSVHILGFLIVEFLQLF
jgi:hypothetical protein